MTNADAHVPASAASRRPMLAVLAGAGFIAASAPMVRLADTTAGMAAFFRCALAVPVLWALMVADRKRAGRRPLPRKARWLARLAGLALAGDLMMWSHTINAVGAGLATVLGNLQVLFVALIAWAVLGERPARSLMIALPPMLVGVALIAGVFGSDTYGASPALGVLLGTGTSLFYAGYILILRAAGKTTAKSGDVGIIAPLYEATLGAAVGAGVVSLLIGDAHIESPWPSLGWLLLLALSSQVVGWLLISRSLSALPAALTSTLLLVQPVGAVALGAAVFGEDPSAEQLVGVAILLAGVLMATRGSGGPSARGARTRRARRGAGAARTTAPAAAPDAPPAPEPAPEPAPAAAAPPAGLPVQRERPQLPDDAAAQPSGVASTA
ncbi:DMT family transporter [Streptomyces sp. NPDC006512]|uniref:DMT family transporter n=1 Tax=Streptomyces sp. NPDC006512 TaxID=3154307 RepID=UPI0033B90330